jgi:hypothetical protein
MVGRGKPLQRSCGKNPTKDKKRAEKRFPIFEASSFDLVKSMTREALLCS